MKVLGITGGIASGKTTVTTYLTKNNYLVLDSDEFVKEAYQNQDIIKQIKSLFNLDKIDKKVIASIVYRDKDKKKSLENIIHPYVINKLKEGIENNKDQELIFLDIPLLYECHLEYLCDKIIVVSLNKEQQIERLMKRNGLNKAEALLIIDNQMSLEDKVNKSDIVIDNNQDESNLYQQIDKIVKEEKENG